MLGCRVLSRASWSLSRRAYLLHLSERQPSSILCNHLNSSQFQSPCKVFTSDHSTFSSSLLRRFGISSSASPESNGKQQGNPEKNDASVNAKDTKENEKSEAVDQAKTSGLGEEKAPNKKEKSGPEKSEVVDQAKASGSGEEKVPNEKEKSDSDSDEELSMEDLVKLLTEKEDLLKVKHKQLEDMQDKVLRSYAEMENVMDRTRREAESAKKYAIQSFAKTLLDVADNLGRASSVVKESFLKIDTSNDNGGAAPLLKTLLEGVEMTEKQLLEVFKKFGIERYDPANEPFDPHRHHAVFQIPDGSKAPGTVAAVLKPGYMLYDRVLRHAEVGVTRDVESNTSDNDSAEKGSAT